MTPRRFRRLRDVLEHRQPDLTVLMDNVHKPHNLSAVGRSADAVGIGEIHAVSELDAIELFHGVSGGSRRWVQVRAWPAIAPAVATLREAGMRLLAAHPAPKAVDFREVDYTGPTAVLLGQEKDGLTAEAADLADAWIAIPTAGMVRSLNVSVAAALILFEAYRQRQRAGLYEHCRLAPEELRRTLFEWAYPDFAQRCRDAGVDYPEVADDGSILGEIPR